MSPSPMGLLGVAWRGLHGKAGEEVEADARVFGEPPEKKLQASGLQVEQERINGPAFRP